MAELLKLITEHQRHLLNNKICNDTLAFYPVAILNAPYHLAHVYSYHNKIRLICGKKKKKKTNQGTFSLDDNMQY